jgi:tetratricopeptide (TPR) repeat protein
MVLMSGLAQACLSPAQTAPRRPADAPGSRSSFEALRAAATEAREKDQVDRALELYRKAVAARPDWAEGWWFLGVLNYDRQQYAPAVGAFEQFVRVEPDNGQGWGMLGLCEAQLQRTAPALGHIEKASSLGFGGNEELVRVARYHQALLLTGVGEFETALGILSAFAVENRQSDAVLDAMGRAILRRREPVEKLPVDDRAMVREFGRAVFLEAAQKLDEAGRLYEELEAKYRGKPNVSFAYAIDLQLRHQNDRAREYFRKELERDPGHLAALLQLANDALTTGALDDGLAYAERAVQIAPGNGVGYYFLGRVHLRRNDLPRAAAMLEKAASLEPQAPNVRYSLAQCYTRMKRPQAAARARAEYERLEAQLKRRTGMVPFEPK